VCRTPPGGQAWGRSHRNDGTRQDATKSARRANQILISGNCVKSKNKNISLLISVNQNYNPRRLIPERGVDRRHRTLGWDAVDAGSVGAFFAPDEALSAYGEVVWSWRRDAGAKPAEQSAGDGDNKPAHRGEHDISRKAIAQGMSECFRSPVCSCAPMRNLWHMRPRVQRAPGIPCALCLSRGTTNLDSSGANQAARTPQLVIAPRRLLEGPLACRYAR
jgi:hypothetical protein